MTYAVATYVAHRTIFEASCARSAFRRTVTVSVGHFISGDGRNLHGEHRTRVHFTQSKFVIH
jgi:hypothetical protein